MEHLAIPFCVHAILYGPITHERSHTVLSSVALRRAQFVPYYDPQCPNVCSYELNWASDWQ